MKLAENESKFLHAFISSLLYLQDRANIHVYFKTHTQTVTDTLKLADLSLAAAVEKVIKKLSFLGSKFSI